MTQTQQQIVLSWLRDAHAMEVGAIPTLRDHASAAKNYPDVQAKLNEHAEATRRHADLVEGCTKRLGSHPSALKEAVGIVMGKVTGVANLSTKDTVVKNALGDYAAENFEIACYKSLIAAAEKIGDHETADVCKRILRDEEEMAGWLGGHIPTITQEFLTEQAGEDGQTPHGALGAAGQTVTGLGEKGKELASSVSPKNALLASGALLAGAGGALLIGQALRSGSKEHSQEPRERDESSGTDSDVQVSEVEAGYAIIDESAGTESESLDTQLLETVALLEAGTDSSTAFSQGGETALESEPQIPSPTDTLLYTEVWLVPGPYTGIGPKGYDSAGGPAGQEVVSRLTQHGQIDASNIEITILDGEVLLEGTVDSDETKRLTEEATESIPNVNSVQNLLKVQTSQ